MQHEEEEGGEGPVLKATQRLASGNCVFPSPGFKLMTVLPEGMAAARMGRRAQRFSKKGRVG